MATDKPIFFTEPKERDCTIIFPRCEIRQMTAIGNNEFNVVIRALLSKDHALYHLVPPPLCPDDYDEIKQKAEWYDQHINLTVKHIKVDNVIRDTRVTLPQSLYDELVHNSLRLHQILRQEQD